MNSATSPTDFPASADAIFAGPRRSNWIRLRTLITLRWIAISGQILAILTAQLTLDLDLKAGLVAATIAAAIITNLAAAMIFPENKRLNESGLFGVLLFDMSHLSLLLMLTGGLNNPFASLILAQVAISATALRLPATLVVCGVALTLTTLNMLLYIPLQTHSGEVLQLPPLFLVGFWAAICVGVIFQASYAHRVTREMTSMADALAATQMALAREQKLTDLGGVVAAAAHELGTPLATIALVSGELIEDGSLSEDQKADAKLIRDQSERCRLILKGMGRSGKRDTLVQQAPLSSVLEEAAAPHCDRGAAVLFDLKPKDGSTEDEPMILRRPEIIHGLRNLIQNAVDFAETSVWIDARWDETQIFVRISDDGPGYPVDLLPLLGDPFTGRRNRSDDPREGYQGMGLGLFIAKTLLERSMAELIFANGRGRFGTSRGSGQRKGAIVSVVWPQAALRKARAAGGAFEQNSLI